MCEGNRQPKICNLQALVPTCQGIGTNPVAVSFEM